MRLGILFILINIFTNLYSQHFNQTTVDSKKGDTILIDLCYSNVFQQHPYNEWYIPNYNSYQPDNEVLNKLSSLINEDIHIITFFGSWCSDTKEQLPRFMAILSKLNVPEDLYDLVAVDRTKKALTFDVTQYNIERIPTFIIFRNGKEIGRIVETPKETLEKDLFKILNQ